MYTTAYEKDLCPLITFTILSYAVILKISLDHQNYDKSFFSNMTY